MTQLRPAALLAVVTLSAVAIACAKTDDHAGAGQESDYTQYAPGANDGGSIADEAPGIALDADGFPVEKSMSGFSFGGCEYWPYAVSENPYPDHIVWGCAPGSTPEARKCLAAGMRRLASILKDPPPELLAIKAKYNISSFFNWNNDYTGAAADRQSTEQIWLYNGRLIKWMSSTNRDGTCSLPERSDLVEFANECLSGGDAGPGC